MSELDAVLSLLVTRLAQHLRATAPEEQGGGGAAQGPPEAERRAEAERWATWLDEWAATHPGTDVAPAGSVPLDRLRERVDLEPAEVELVALAGMPDENSGFAGALRALHPRSEARPTVGLALLLLGAWRQESEVLHLLHGGAAVRSATLEVSGLGAFTERSLVLPDGLWVALRGLELIAAPRSVPIGGPLAGLEGWLSTALVQDAVTALGQPDPTVVLVLADDEAIALGRCTALASAAGTTPLVRRCAPDDALELGRLTVLAAVRGQVPVAVIFGPSVHSGPPRGLDSSMASGPLLVAAPPGSVSLTGPEPVIGLTITPVPPADQRRAWQSVLPGQADLPAQLAARHNLDPALTAQLAADLSRRAENTPEQVAAMVTESIRGRASAALPAGARLNTPDAGWDRLVLPKDDIDVLREAVSRLELQPLVLEEWDMRRAARADRGVRLLFAGPPGTGKTLAAEVVATAMASDLLTVDVANIVSKWIGETEKNLGAVFDVAERTQSVLFLDEADALFGSRTKVSDALDRYANLETAYLLQRLDRFQGLAVLATNLRQNIDPAFTRRMDFVVEFDLPDHEARRAMWDLHLPAGVRRRDVDTDVLAQRYAVAGGWIRNAAIAAAFLAAREGGKVTQDHLLTALRREYAKDSRTMPVDPAGARRSAGRLAAPDQRAIQALAAPPKEST